MSEFVHTWRSGEQVITFTWLGKAKIMPTRVYAFAFDPNGQMLLVSDANSAEYWLPGGGVEVGEMPEGALARELLEEAAATVERAQVLGIQAADDTHKIDYHAFYACRVSLAEGFVPSHEITERRLVSPSQLLDTLFWGRDDPKGEMLLEKAVRVNEQFATEG